MATIHDADVLLWAVSQINGARKRGEKHSARLSFQPYDLLKSIHRGASGKIYKDLRAALKKTLTLKVTAKASPAIGC